MGWNKEGMEGERAVEKDEIEIEMEGKKKEEEKGLEREIKRTGGRFLFKIRTLCTIYIVKVNEKFSELKCEI